MFKMRSLTCANPVLETATECQLYNLQAKSKQANCYATTIAFCNLK